MEHGVMISPSGSVGQLLKTHILTKNRNNTKKTHYFHKICLKMYHIDLLNRPPTAKKWNMYISNLINLKNQLLRSHNYLI